MFVGYLWVKNIVHIQYMYSFFYRSLYFFMLMEENLRKILGTQLCVSYICQVEGAPPPPWISDRRSALAKIPYTVKLMSVWC